jgi:hypothetical protein
MNHVDVINAHLRHVHRAQFLSKLNHRRLREHRDLTLLLNTLLRGRTNLQPRRSNHFWASIPCDGAAAKPGP